MWVHISMNLTMYHCTDQKRQRQKAMTTIEMFSKTVCVFAKRWVFTKRQIRRKLRSLLHWLNQLVLRLVHRTHTYWLCLYTHSVSKRL